MRLSGKIPAQDFITAKKSPLVQDLFGAYIVLNYKQKYKNIFNTLLYMKSKMVKCKKWVNRKSKGAKNNNAGSNFRKVRKFCTLRNFFAGFIFLASSTLLSF